MNKPQDIIGLVKFIKSGEIDGWPKDGVKCKNAEEVEICNNFPAIADALLIAVGALENLAVRSCNQTPCKTALYGLCSGCTAKEALSKIRSLKCQ